MSLKKKSSIYPMLDPELLSDYPYKDFIIDTNLFEKTIEEFRTILARNNMGGNEGIHKIENYG